MTPKRIHLRDVPVHPAELQLEPDADGNERHEPNPLAGQVDHDALAAELGEDAVWVGPGSKWALPWEAGTGSFAVHDGLSVNTDDPEDLNRALAIAIRWSLPIYPTAHEIRSELAGKNLADFPYVRHPSHADVLLAVAAGKEYQP
jgi:hypothetical protein